jgi:hypothetical protein
MEQVDESSTTTVEDYLKDEWPDLLEIFLDPPAAMREIETEAAAMAHNLGITAGESLDGMPTYPIIVWRLVLEQ